MRRGWAIGALVSLVLLGGSESGRAYLKLGTTVGSRPVPLVWGRLPVRYYVTDRGVAGVTASQLHQAVSRAFATWEAVPTARVGFEFAGFIGAEPGVEDGASTLGFKPLEEPRVLARTRFLVDLATGQLLEADVEFNSNFPWSVAPAGEAGRYDLESIAVHEIGHFIGLGHSAIGETELRPEGGRRVLGAESVMFPIAFVAGNIEDRRLRADDVAGVGDLYPAGDLRQRTGSLTGRVVRDGRGVFGAHVVAFHLASGALVGGFTLASSGEFTIAGLEPGLYLVRVEPLDDGDVESFLPERVREVDLGFRVTFAPTLVAVPRGGTSAPVEIQVVAK
jgi:hypothetical protein